MSQGGVGLGLEAGPDGWKVIGVAPGGACEAAGVKIGAILVEVDGHRLGHEDPRPLLLGQPGTSVSLLFRGEVPRNLERRPIGPPPSGHSVAFATPVASSITPPAGDAPCGVGLALKAHPAGFLVTAVAPGSPAEAAGVWQGELVVSIDGEPMAGKLQAQQYTLGPPGSNVSLRFAGKDEAVVLQRRPLPRNPPQASRPSSNLPVAQEPCGVGLALQPHPRGWIVAEIVPGSPAATAGVSYGDILLQVDGQLVAGLNVQKLLLGPEGSKVSLLFEWQDEVAPQTVVLERRRSAKPPTPQTQQSSSAAHPSSAQQPGWKQPNDATPPPPPPIGHMGPVDNPRPPSTGSQNPGPIIGGQPQEQMHRPQAPECGVGIGLRAHPHGFVIAELAPGGPAALAGVTLGEVVVQVDDVKLTPGIDPRPLLVGQPGTRVTLHLAWRDGGTTSRVILERQPLNH